MTRKKKPPASLVRSSAAEYLTFVAASGTGGVEAVYADENVWLSQKMMAQLYDVDVRTINYHLKTLFTDSELEEDAVIRSFRITAADGQNLRHQALQPLSHHREAMTDPTQTDDVRTLLELETSARAEVLLPADAHVIGEPVTVTQIRYPGLSRVGLLATCGRGDVTYEVGLADVVFPAASVGASLVARYRTWLGLAPFVAPGFEVARPHKVEGDDIVVGRPVDLVVLACKSNALRCRLLGSAREVTLRTAVHDEIPGSIITVTPKKQWSHARHPYLSGDVSSVRIDASVLGLVPLALHREDEPHHASAGRDAVGEGRPVYRLAQLAPPSDDACADLLLEAEEHIDAGAYAEADALLHKVLAVDLRCLDAHALLGERNLSHLPGLALHHFELGVAVGSLTVGGDFDGVLPWGLVENRPFLRCLQGLSRALLRLEHREAAAAVLRRLQRLDPVDHLCARASLAAIEAGKEKR